MRLSAQQTAEEVALRPPTCFDHPASHPRPAIMVMVRTRGAREAPSPPLAGLGARSLSDEELAWRLHQELNAGMGSPALHTRTRNPGTSTEGTSGEGSGPGAHRSPASPRGVAPVSPRAVRTRADPGPGPVRAAPAARDVAPEAARAPRTRAGGAVKPEPSAARDAPAPAPAAARGAAVSSAQARTRPATRHGGAQPTTRMRDGFSSEEEEEEEVKVESDAEEEEGGERAGPAAGPSRKRGAASAPAPARAAKPLRIPKLPMVLQGRGSWYRARVVKDAGDRVLLEFTGFEDQFPALWLARGTDRIWRGSYRGKDWKYLGGGAWEPKKAAGAGARHARKAAAGPGAHADAAASGEGPGAGDDSPSVHSARSDGDSHPSDGRAAPRAGAAGGRWRRSAAAATAEGLSEAARSVVGGRAAGDAGPGPPSQHEEVGSPSRRRDPATRPAAVATAEIGAAGDADEAPASPAAKRVRRILDPIVREALAAAGAGEPVSMGAGSARRAGARRARDDPEVRVGEGRAGEGGAAPRGGRAGARRARDAEERPPRGVDGDEDWPGAGSRFPTQRGVKSTPAPVSGSGLGRTPTPETPLGRTSRRASLLASTPTAGGAMRAWREEEELAAARGEGERAGAGPGAARGPDEGAAPAPSNEAGRGAGDAPGGAPPGATRRRRKPATCARAPTGMDMDALPASPRAAPLPRKGGAGPWPGEFADDRPEDDRHSVGAVAAAEADAHAPQARDRPSPGEPLAQPPEAHAAGRDRPRRAPAVVAAAAAQRTQRRAAGDARARAWARELVEEAEYERYDVTGATREVQQRARRPGAAAAPRGSRAHADPGALTAKEVYGSILGALGACVAGQEGVADLARCGSWDNPAKPLLFSACGGWSETRWHVGGAAAPPRILEVSSDLFSPRAVALEEVGARPPLPLFH
ncbi:hypothetical protein ACKKBF_B33905 [Auxenochlorella protothecoides x Auxenochlorella symbiontica]